MLTRKKRQVLFWFSILIFTALLVPVFLFSFGYGVGPGLKIQRTGGIAINSSQANALVAVNIFRRKKTSILGKSALIKNLVPGKYEVKVQKEGFWEWKKNLKVESEKVAFREALLVPLEINGEILGTTTPAVETKPKLPPSVKKFWELKKSGEILILGEDKKFYRNNKPENKIATTTLEILKKSKNSFFSEDEQEIIVWDGKNVELFWIGEPDQMPLWMDKEHYISFSSEKTINDVKNYPNKADYLISSFENGIFAVEKEKPNNIAPLYKGKNPKIISLEQDSLIFFDDDHYIKINLP